MCSVKLFPFKTCTAFMIWQGYLMVTSTQNAAQLPQTLPSMVLDQGLTRSQATIENSTLWGVFYITEVTSWFQGTNKKVLWHSMKARTDFQRSPRRPISRSNKPIWPPSPFGTAAIASRTLEVQRLLSNLGTKWSADWSGWNHCFTSSLENIARCFGCTCSKLWLFSRNMTYQETTGSSKQKR